MRPIVLAIFVAVVWITLSIPQQAQAAPAPACGVNLAAPEIKTAIDSVPPVPEGWPWSREPRSFGGNYNPCATLSTALISIQGATGSSPRQALFFHKGTYVGTATSAAYSFVSWNTAATTDDTVALDYTQPVGCDACGGPITTVRYRWQADHVQMLDGPPPQSNAD